jgi:hypothetical protein
MRAAFAKAGITSHDDWITGNFFGGSPPPTDGDICAGSAGPLEHEHFFTAAGGFSSRDEHGSQVDDGDFTAVDANTITFPSHAKEFGTVEGIFVDYAVSGDTVTFTVVTPSPCTAACADGYAWALSAFASGSWQRGSLS